MKTMLAAVTSGTPSNLVSAQTPSMGEQSFRAVWENVMSTNYSDEDRIKHLKAELRGWMVGARGHSRRTPAALMFGAKLDEEDEGLLSELNNIIVDAVREKYELDRVIRYLQCTATANGGLEL